jgi:hypothetical protein
MASYFHAFLVIIIFIQKGDWDIRKAILAGLGPQLFRYIGRKFRGSFKNLGNFSKIFAKFDLILFIQTRYSKIPQYF